MDKGSYDLSNQSRKDLVDHWVKRNKKYLDLLLYLGTATLSVWYIYPLIDGKDYNLMVAMKLPFLYDTNKSYSIVYPIVLLSFHYISYFVVINDLLLQVYLIHLICQISILVDCFKNVVKEGFERGQNTDCVTATSTENFIRRLNSLVQQHQSILSNTSELKSLLSFPMLGQFLASILLICFAGYQVTASESIRDAVYSCGWEDGVATLPGVRSRLMTVMMRASRPLHISAGGLYDVSLEAYSTLVKTSYSALTVLLRLRNN